MKKIDPLECNVPNICFSHATGLPKNDDRLETYKEQRLERGFDDSELWNLDITIINFILPRLEEWWRQQKKYAKLEDAYIKKMDNQV